MSRDNKPPDVEPSEREQTSGPWKAILVAHVYLAHECDALERAGYGVRFVLSAGATPAGLYAVVLARRRELPP